jgi:hypothetical protein
LTVTAATPPTRTRDQAAERIRVLVSDEICVVVMTTS